MNLLREFTLPPFADSRERVEFWRHSDARKFVMRRFFIFFGIIAYLAHAVMDYAVGGENVAALSQIRFICGGVSILLGVLFHFKAYRRITDNTLIALILGVGCVSVIAMSTCVDGIPAATYPLGLIVILAFGGIVLSLRTLHTFVLSLLTYVLFWAVVPISEIPTLALPIVAFFLAIGLAAVAVGALMFERYERLQVKADWALKEKNAALSKMNEDLQKARVYAETVRDEAVAVNRAQGVFISSMSHELRTPLNAILGFSEMMQGELLGPMPDAYKDYSGDIHNAGEILLANINDLLDLQRLQAGKMSWEENVFPLSDLIQRVMSLCGVAADAAQVSLVHNEPGFAVDIRADIGRIAQAVTNLVTNSAKFTDAGGAIILSAALSNTHDLEIRVTDTGIGISPEDLQRIQRPFQQAGDGIASVKKDGLGLGLAIVSGILDIIGGHLRIESDLDVGTTATIILPAARLSNFETRMGATSCAG